VDLIEQMSLGSSSRSVLLWQSLETFLRHPILGFGFQEDMTEVGGHSFFFDTAASFGVIGLVPAVAFFGLIILGLRAARKRAPGSWPLAASTIFVLTLVLGLIINPYLLEMLSLSYFIFLFLGMALADTEAVVTPRPVVN
jgi:O-antigen ligase